MDPRKELRAWTLISLVGLALSGVIVIAVLAGRVPIIYDFGLWNDAPTFKKGLVGHVIFSFVVWFLTVFATFLAYARIKTGQISGDSKTGLVAIALTVAGFIGLVIPTFNPSALPSLNNYVPILNDGIYYTGLILLFVGVALVALRNLVEMRNPVIREDPFSRGLSAISIIYMISLICFAIAWSQVPKGLEDLRFNELIFWGGGHVLQFLNTGLLILCWMLIAKCLWSRDLMSSPVTLICFVVLAAFCLPSPLSYYFLDLTGPEHRALFTELLRYGLVISPTLAGFAVVMKYVEERGIAIGDYISVALILSVFMFNLSGVFGLMLDGSDTRVPGHYHAAIGSIQIVLMAVFFKLILPELNAAPIEGKWGKRMLKIQIYFYGIGQTVHAAGLFLAGGHGVQRKTSGAAQALDSAEKKIAAGIFGLGGALAILAGAIFVIMALRALLKKPKNEPILSESA